MKRKKRNFFSGSVNIMSVNITTRLKGVNFSNAPFIPDKIQDSPARCITNANMVAALVFWSLITSKITVLTGNGSDGAQLSVVSLTG